MKFQSIHLRIIIFLAVMIFFVLPPVFVPKTNALSFEWGFPFVQMFFAFFAVILLYVKNLLDTKTNTNNEPYKNAGLDNGIVNVGETSNTSNNKTATNENFPTWLKRALIFGNAIGAFGLITFTAVVLEWVGRFFMDTQNFSVSRPSTALQYFFALTTYIFAALYEEGLYRVYLPETLFSLLASSSPFSFFCPNQPQRLNQNPKQNKIIFWCTEIFCVLIFALAHRYLGVLAVINALVAATAFRVCYKKTKMIFPCVAVHAAYNMIMMLVFAA